MGIQSFRSVCLVTSRFKMMKLVLVLFVATVLISRSASNPVRHAKGVSIGGDVGHVCNNETGQGCGGAQNGSTGKKKKRSIAQAKIFKFNSNSNITSES